MSENQSPTGLSTQEAEQRLQQYGPNALEARGLPVSAYCRRPEAVEC